MQRVLVIEDEKEMARGLKDIFEFEGYEVATAETGREGLHAISRKVPDCIILDLMLPDLSGYEVCEQIRQKLDTPILMLTAKAQDHDKILGFKVGADDYLTKPFRLELFARVMALLRRTLITLRKWMSFEWEPISWMSITSRYGVGKRNIPCLITKWNCSNCYMRMPTNRLRGMRFSTKSGEPINSRPIALWTISL